MGADTHGEFMFAESIGPIKDQLLNLYKSENEYKDSQIKQLKYLVEFYERELDLKKDELKVANGLLKELERQLSFYADKNQNQ